MQPFDFVLFCLRKDIEAEYSSVVDYGNDDTIHCGTDYNTVCPITRSGATISCDGCDFSSMNATYETISSSSSRITCTDESPNCIINCIDENDACWDIDLYCRPIESFVLESTECTHCIINCANEYACDNVRVYSFDCDTVTINALAPESFLNSKIYAQNMSSNGTVSILAQNVFDFINAADTAYFRNNLIESDQNRVEEETNLIIELDCNGVECDNNQFFVTKSEYFEMNCFNGADCTDNNIYCPKNGKNDYSDAACNIVYDDSEASGNQFFTIDGLPRV